MTDPNPANDNDDTGDPEDGLLLLDDSEDVLTDPGVLDELLAGLHIGRRYLLSRAPERAARFLPHNYSVLIARRGLADAMPDLAARIRGARRIFVDAHVGADSIQALADGLRADQRISILLRKSDRPLPTGLRPRLSSLLFIDAATAELPPPALQRR